MDPNVEFSEQPTESAPPQQPTPPAPPAVDPAEVAALQRQLASTAQELQGLRGKSEVLDRMAALFGSKTADPKEEFVRNEIRKHVPEVNDVGQMKAMLAATLQALEVEAEARLEEKVGSARENLGTLIEKAGYDPQDQEVLGYLEEAVTREIRTNAALIDLWNRGQIKQAVNKAWTKVNDKIVAPQRLRSKRDAVTTIREAPRAVPRGESGVGQAAPAPKSVDFSDTSRAGVQKLHDAAFERLQQLIEE